MDQQICILGQLYHPEVGTIGGVVDVAGIDDSFAVAANAIAKHTAWMVKPSWEYRGIVAYDDLFPVVNLFDQEVGMQIGQREGKVGIAHLPGQHLVQPPINAAFAQDNQPAVA